MVLSPTNVTTVILCGGKGTRAYPHTVTVPKPLLEVGGRPVLEHVMEIYASQDFTRFVLSAGYKHELIEEFAARCPPQWAVSVIDTGEHTETGDRIRDVRDHLGDVFFATYADGLGDVDLRDLLAFHQSHAGVATLTAVPLPSQYGTIELEDGDQVVRFREKPQLPDHWINAGFFVFDHEAFDHWHGHDLENDVLPGLVAEASLFAFKHRGFWKSMDTYKDALALTELCTTGGPPWKI